MKNNQLTFILVGVFFLATLGTSVLSWRFVSSVRKLQEMQPAIQAKMALMNNTKAFLEHLGTETAEYAKKDPNINAVLQSLNTPANSAAVLPKTPAK